MSHPACRYVEGVTYPGLAPLVGPLGWEGSGNGFEDVSGVATFALAVMIVTAVIGIGGVLALLFGGRRPRGRT